jgi:ABC-type multidrug transport system fused ATPase/permease subunit
LSSLIAVTGSRVLAGALTAGDAIALIQISTRSIFPFTSLGNLWAALQQNLAASDRLREALNTPQEKGGFGSLERPSSALSIEFRDVSFGYGDKQVLSGVSFLLPAGKKMALRGASGSGKTTILKLLLGMYCPASGSIKLGDSDIRKMSLPALRGAFSVVPQEPWLFPGTVRDNILLGRSDATIEDVVKAAQQANAHDFIEALPQGYETVLDERGGNLSGGQRQRARGASRFQRLDAGVRKCWPGLAGCGRDHRQAPLRGP